MYNNVPLIIPAGANVPFSTTAVTTGDIVHTPGSTDILINTPGTYQITFSVTSTDPNEFALTLNDTLIPGGVYGVAIGGVQNTGQVVVFVPAPGVLRLLNTSGEAVNLPANIGGTAGIVNASVRVARLSSDMMIQF